MGISRRNLSCQSTHLPLVDVLRRAVFCGCLEAPQERDRTLRSPVGITYEMSP